MANTSKGRNAKNTTDVKWNRSGTLLALNDGPSTPVKNYGGNMGYKTDYGWGRIKNVRPKPGLTLKDVTGY